jgi:hypothetical protein
MTRRSRAQARGLALAALLLAGCTEDLPLATRSAADPADVTTLIIVTTTADDGPGSLREAIDIAPSGTTIRFAPELAGETIEVSTSFYVNSVITVEGPTTAPVTIAGDGVRLFLVDVSGNLTLRNMVLTRGFSFSSGGAISLIAESSRLTVENSTISHSYSVSNGAAIGGDGTVTVMGSTLFGNFAVGVGGAIHIYDGSLAILNSTISGNSASVHGGGISVGNQAILTLFYSTVADNEAPMAGGISVLGSAELGHNILANNSGGNCGGGPLEESFNISSDLTCGFDEAAGGLNNTDPLIGPLADNGGLTLTHRPMAGSPVVDASLGPCRALLGSVLDAVDHDQRGVARPQGTHCDMGAVEQTAATLAIASATVDSKTGAATLRGTVQCSGLVDVEISVMLEQAQKARKVNTTVHASGEVVIPCSGEAEWSITLQPSSGAFRNGAATATAATDADLSDPVISALQLRWAK